MRRYPVKICERCPYTPGMLGEHYDSHAPRHCCAVCDEPPPVTHFPLETRETQYLRGWRKSEMRASL